jgi:hypothetical protein
MNKVFFPRCLRFALDARLHHIAKILTRSMRLVYSQRFGSEKAIVLRTADPWKG